MASLDFTARLFFSPGPILSRPIKQTNAGAYLGSKRKHWRCTAYRRQGQPSGDYDLYELLGVDESASQKDIRRSYRWLQKKCHPDVAGAIGHDMSILLNEAYSILSDPDCRAAYNQERAALAEFEGYTGQPIYSKWFGPADESRAVFVDESHCVGCLKCALIASNTFAIESQYGRARAVGQWADPEPLIEDAIKACPVDCIFWVPRSKLAALEFVMSKQPRFHVGINPQNSSGIRVADVYHNAEKFLERKRLKEQETLFRETASQRHARMAAMEVIQTRAGRWWHHIIGKRMTEYGNRDSDYTRASQGAIVPLCYFETDPSTRVQKLDSNVDADVGWGQVGSDSPDELGRLFEAARRRQCANSAITNAGLETEEYWVPPEPRMFSVDSLQVDSVSFFSEDSASIPRQDMHVRNYSYMPDWAESLRMNDRLQWVEGIFSTLPLIVSVAAAIVVGFTGGTDAALSETGISGPLPQELTNSLMMQVFLAAGVWYVIGTVFCASAVLVVVLYNAAFDQKRPES